GILLAVPDEHMGWVWSTILVSTLFVMVAMARAGSKLFWVVAPVGTEVELPTKPRRGRRSEIAAIILLLVYCVGMTLAASPVMRYAMAAGEQLAAPENYIQSVRTTTPNLREP
ncbi:MAG: monovalent cation/H+ antiporter subunit D, partial [Lysobacteraceae bacterium]